MYSNGPGASSLIVMVTVAEDEPPLLFAQIVYVVAIVWRTVGIPQIVPLLVPKLRPAGNVAFISHEVISPAPVIVGASGRSALTVLLVKSNVAGV